MEFTGRVALITGAGSGIGAATARLLASQGAAIAAVGRAEEELHDTVAGIREAGGEAQAYGADIADPAQIGAAVEAAATRWGRIDIVFANAGINGVWAPLDQLTPAEWELTLRVNLTGTFLTVQAALPYLKRRGGAVIITSSVNGTRIFSNTGATAYSVSKAGQVAFAKMIALELAQFRIRVNVICPGAIKTDIHKSTERRNLERVKIPVDYQGRAIPLTDGKHGMPEQVAEVVRFLASDAASHVTGTELWIDGAQSLLIG